MIAWLLEQAEISDKIMHEEGVEYTSYTYNQGRRDMCLEVLKYIEDNSRKLKESE